MTVSVSSRVAWPVFVLLAAGALAGCTGGQEEREAEARETGAVTQTVTPATTETVTTVPAVPPAIEAETGTVPEDQEAEAAELQEQILDLVCATSRRPGVYRAPSLYREPILSEADPNGFWRVSVSGKTKEGFDRLEKVRCRQVVVLGASRHPVVGLGGDPLARWIFVTLAGNDPMRGWVYAEGGSAAAGWPGVPAVDPDILYSSRKGLPDLRFGSYTQAYKVGEPCPMGDPSTWNLVISNAASGGAGPKKLTVEIDPQYRTEAQGKVVDASGTVAFTFARTMAPGESVVLGGVPYNTRVRLDPKNRLAESDEDNNSLLLPTGQILTCGGLGGPGAG